MALLQLDYYSKALSKTTQVQVLIPNDMPAEMVTNNKAYERPMKVLYLYHGFSGACKDWLYGSNVQELSIKYNMAIVMPSADNSFYLNGKGTGKAYQTFVGEELPDYVNRLFGFSKERQDTYVGGLSMGGFGAIHTGIAYNNRFSKVVALSSALIIHTIEHMTSDVSDAIADYDYYYSVFGNLDELSESSNNPEALYKTKKAAKEILPEFYMACGTEDFLIEQNRSFHAFLEEQEADVTYTEDHGIHDWNFWNKFLEPSMQWLVGE